MALPEAARRRAVFLDRDGVLIENREPYVLAEQHAVLLPGAVEAIRALSARGFAIVLVTNQACVGKGLLSLERAEAINAHVLTLLADRGAVVSCAYLCPHRDTDGCACRKPRPGMLLRAQSELGLELAACFLVGDARSDVEAARAVGVTAIMVRTGRGTPQLTGAGPGWPQPQVAVDIAAAAQLVIEAAS